MKMVLAIFTQVLYLAIIITNMGHHTSMGLDPCSMDILKVIMLTAPTSMLLEVIHQCK